MSIQTGKRPSTTAARGDKADTGTPVTVAPVKKWAPSTNVKQFAPGYGTNLDPSPSSVEGARTSGLADELRRVAANSDAGDLLGKIIERGCRMNSDTDDGQRLSDIGEKASPVHPNMKAPNSSGTVPTKLGASAAPPPKEPYGGK